MKSPLAALAARFGEDRWIPLCFVLFFVGLALVEARLIYLATSTYRGLVTEQPYERGLHYDRVIAEEKAQAERGWRVALSFDGKADTDSQLSVTVADRQGKPIEGAQVRVIAERTTRQAQAIPATLDPAEPGTYRAPLRLPVGGPWTLRVIVIKNGEVHRHIERTRVAGSTQS